MATNTRTATRPPGAGDLGLVFVGGAAGALLRVALSTLAPYDGGLPWTTLGENVAGAFLLAWLFTRIRGHGPGDRRARLLLGTGMLGAFTTYSALAVELTALLAGPDPLLGLAYAAASLAGGLAAAVAGVAAGRRGDAGGRTP